MKKVYRLISEKKTLRTNRIGTDEFISKEFFKVGSPLDFKYIEESKIPTLEVIESFEDFISKEHLFFTKKGKIEWSGIKIEKDNFVSLTTSYKLEEVDLNTISLAYISKKMSAKEFLELLSDSIQK